MADQSRLSRLTSGQWLGVTAGALILVALIGLGVSLVAVSRLSDTRRFVVDRVDPARVAAQQYLTALVDEETGVRGYALSGRREHLAPYVAGRRAARTARERLGTIAEIGDVPGLQDDLRTVQVRVAGWRLIYADPVVVAVRQLGYRSPDIPPLDQGEQQFDQVRAGFAQMDARLAGARADGRDRLRHAANALQAAVLFSGVLLLAAAFVASSTLRRVVAAPLSRLARDARRVARGEFGHTVAVQGPRDIVGLSTDVESMRRRILSELEAVTAIREQLEAQAVELQRSNAELEQFAYVASHDLQEPLRKVASFCGMLQHRYHGQLDERADQYIDFAVDGAKRMQVLINDLLAFSRVGRTTTEHEPVAMDDVLAEATGNLGAAVEEAAATVTADGPLPVVRGDRTLLVALVQNLVANALKFHEDGAAPRVRITVERDGDRFRFGVHDNGIGVAHRYADRIFVIFQRLHPKEEYSGTGIGLAMCRKIVEFHGGEIWLEPEGADGGATFSFTLPVPEEDA